MFSCNLPLACFGRLTSVFYMIQEGDAEMSQNKADSGKDKSAGDWTCNLEIMSTALYH